MEVVIPERLLKRIEKKKTAGPGSLEELVAGDAEVRKALLNPVFHLGSLSWKYHSKVCDFTFATAQRTAQRQEAGDEFVAVERSVRTPWGGRGGRGRARETAMPKGAVRNIRVQTGGRKDKLSAAYQRVAPVNRQHVLRARVAIAEYAVPMEEGWQLIAEPSLQVLSAQAVRDTQLEDLKFAGAARRWRKLYDVIQPREAVDVQALAGETQAAPTADDARAEARLWTHAVPNARGDETLATVLESDESVSAIATDQVLAALMTAGLSRFGWQIVAFKFGDKIILDKESEEQDNLDLLTINETVPLELMSDQRQKEAALQAARLQLAFQVQAVDDVVAVGDPAAAEAVAFEGVPERLYRYRVLTLPPPRDSRTPKPPLKLAVRAEIHAAAMDSTGALSEYFRLHALHEGLLRSTAPAWTTALERHKGALVLNELRANACKCARWACAAYLAGAASLKIAFISKKQDLLTTRPRDLRDPRPRDTRHAPAADPQKTDAPVPDPLSQYRILAVQTTKVADLIQQMGLRLPNAWGVVRQILDIILEDTAHTEGKYIITRDALTSTLKIHYTDLSDDFAAPAHNEHQSAQEDSDN